MIQGRLFTYIELCWFVYKNIVQLPLTSINIFIEMFRCLHAATASQLQVAMILFVIESNFYTERDTSLYQYQKTFSHGHFLCICLRRRLQSAMTICCSCASIIIIGLFVILLKISS